MDSSGVTADSEDTLRLRRQPDIKFHGAHMVIDWKAIVSLAFGLIALVYFPLLTGFVALVMGHWSRSSIKQSSEPIRGKNVALVGLVLGYLTLIAVFIGAWQRAHIAQNESSALAALRFLHSPMEEYVRSHDGSYPSVLSDLKGIDAGLVVGERNGYKFTYHPVVRDGTMVGYWLEAKALRPGISGSRTFCTDQTGNIHAAQPDQHCTDKSPLM